MLINKDKIKNICEVCKGIDNSLEETTVFSIAQTLADELKISIRIYSEIDIWSGKITYTFEIGIPFHSNKYVRTDMLGNNVVIPARWGWTYFAPNHKNEKKFNTIADCYLGAIEYLETKIKDFDLR